MIKGELAARNLYASRSAISEALISVDPVGANLRWKDLTKSDIFCPKYDETLRYLLPIIKPVAQGHRFESHCS